MSFYDIYGRLIPYCFLELDFRTNSMDIPSRRAFGKLLEDEEKSSENDYKFGHINYNTLKRDNDFDEDEY